MVEAGAFRPVAGGDLLPRLRRQSRGERIGAAFGDLVLDGRDDMLVDRNCEHVGHSALFQACPQPIVLAVNLIGGDPASRHRGV